MYRSSLKQVQESQPISSLDMNYTRYLDFDNAVTWSFVGYNNSYDYTTTQKCMIFGSDGLVDYRGSHSLSINNNLVLQGNYNIRHFSLDTLTVNAGTVFTRYEQTYESFGDIYFVPFIDQTIIVPDFSEMTDLSDMSYYNIPRDGILLGKITTNTAPYIIHIANDNKCFAGYGSSCIRYVTEGMTIAGNDNSKLVNWYYIPMEE